MSAQQDLEAKSFHLQPGKISPGEKKSCQDSSTPMIFNSSAASREAKRETSGRFPECAASAGALSYKSPEPQNRPSQTQWFFYKPLSNQAGSLLATHIGWEKKSY